MAGARTAKATRDGRARIDRDQGALMGAPHPLSGQFLTMSVSELSEPKGCSDIQTSDKSMSEMSEVDISDTSDTSGITCRTFRDKIRDSKVGANSWAGAAGNQRRKPSPCPPAPCSWRRSAGFPNTSSTYACDRRSAV